MLDVRRLRVLRELALRGTIKAAAEALHLTGPAVSQHLAALERESGTKLIERDGRTVRLTATAHTLVAHAETILAQLEAAEADVAAAEGQFGGRLQIGCFPSFAQLVAPLLVDLQQTMPEVEVGFSELEPEESLARLRVGELDIAIAHAYEQVPRRAEPAIQRFDLLREPMLLALPRDHPLAGPTVALAELADEERWIAPPSGMSCREQLLRMCAQAGFEPQIRSVSYTYSITLALVASGGVALVPQIAARQIPFGVVLARPSGVTGWRQTFAAVRRGSAHRPSLELALGTLHRAVEDEHARV